MRAGINKNRISARDVIFIIIAAAGFLFGLWYIKNACCDVIYSDYIRLVDAYLPDVTNPDKFFVADIFTRVPAAYLIRLLNVELFGYSVTVDRLFTLFGFALCSAALLFYARDKKLGVPTFAFLVFLLYSLNKWEIFINGSASLHVVSFGLFFLNYYLLDKYAFGEEDRAACDNGLESIKEKKPLFITNGPDIAYGNCRRRKALFITLCIFPFVILLFAGEYIASYSAVMLSFTAVFAVINVKGKIGRVSDIDGDNAKIFKKEEKSLKGSGKKVLSYSKTDCEKKNKAAVCKEARSYIFIFICTLIPLILYLISRSFAVWEHAGSTELSLMEFVSRKPAFLPRFFIKSFAGVLLGKETIESLSAYMSAPSAELFTLLLGLSVILAYLIALILYFREELYKKTIFPMILVLSGGFNHVLVTAGRWIFEDESYALSSRYAAQFMIGILGIFLIYSLSWKKESSRGGRKSFVSEFFKGSVSIFVVLFLAGNCYTCYQEIKKMPYREYNYEQMAETIRNHELYTDEELCERLEWRKDPEILKNAIRIIEENKLNVFRERR